MSLSELIRYFNAADQVGESMLHQVDGQVFGWYRDLCLTSLFQPIVDLPSDRVVGHYARLQASYENGRKISEAQAYGLCDDEHVAHFDRLCRTVHALNFLRQRRQTGGYLQVAPHYRHLLAVPNQHGLVYEAILKRCGLAPEDIVLEVESGHFEEYPQLLQAVANYRQRGYRLALCEVASVQQLDKLMDLQPALLKQGLGESQAVFRQARALGLKTLVADIADERMLRSVRAGGFDLAAGAVFGAAATHCQPTHRPRGVAYNAPFLPGVHS